MAYKWSIQKIKPHFLFLKGQKPDLYHVPLVSASLWFLFYWRFSLLMIRKNTGKHFLKIKLFPYPPSKQKPGVIIHPYFAHYSHISTMITSLFPHGRQCGELRLYIDFVACTYSPDLAELLTWTFVLAICVKNSLPWQTRKYEWSNDLRI